MTGKGQIVGPRVALRRIPHLVALAVFLFAAALPAGVSHAQAAEGEREAAIVSRIVAAYGGKDALAKATPVVARGAIASVSRGTGTYLRYLARPGKLRVEIVYGDGSELRVLSGGAAADGALEGPLGPVEEARRAAMRYQYEHDDLPYGLATGRYKVHWLGTDTLDGRAVDVLSLDGPDMPPTKIFVDSERALIVKARGYFSVEGVRTYLSAEFSDFTTVAGVVFPRRTVNFGGGRRIGETRIESVEVGGKLPDDLFAVPGGGR